MRKLFAIVMMLVSIGVSAQDEQVGVEEMPQTSAWKQINPKPFVFSVGYVSKQWATDTKEGTRRENLWGEKGKRLHGMQFGCSFQPNIKPNIGIYTGLYLEIYVSMSGAMGYDNFSEASLYLPLHAHYTLPLSKHVSLRAHAGVGVNWALHGGFTNDDAWYWEYDEYGCATKEYYELSHIRYGREGWPRRLNASAEGALSVAIDNVVVTATYSHGLTNHKMYQNLPLSDTRQNKLGLSVGYNF